MITLTPLNNPEGATQQEYNSAQEALIPVVDSTSEFNPVTDKVIFSAETITGDLLTSEKVSNFSIRNYENTINEDQISSVVVFPVQDIENAGYSVGVYNIYYNFYRTALKSDQYKFFIQEISPSRTELRISVNNVSDEEINSLVQEFQSLLEGEAFKDFYIEINGSYYIANNILADTTSVPNTILLKLYQPLPSSIEVNTQLQVVFETAETVGFNLNLPPKPIKIEEDVTYIKGPNFNYQLSDIVNNSTEEQTYDSLLSKNELTSSYNELENILNQKGIKVNIDYTEFDNFVQFSSAEQRLLNFYYKVGQIEEYNNNITSINAIVGSTSSSLEISSSRAIYEAQITDIIKNFDGYENYLYYTSGALAYPKSNSTQPYILQSTGSTEVLTWLGSVDESSSNYGGRLLTASFYDDENPDNLFNSVPSYLQDDPANVGYELFLNMIGQHFDILYSYINTLTDRYNADNRLDYGISKDLVADALRGAGLKLYQNNFSSDNLYSALLGINENGNLLPPTGSEIIENYVTASNVAFPLENVNKQTYKRLYHNLPYLLKKKGTVEGLRALINCFGVSDTILRISEFGGKDKNNTNDWDYFQNQFNYAYLRTNPSDQDYLIETEFQLNDSWGSPNNLEGTKRIPNTVQFRFKVDSTPPTSSLNTSLLLIPSSSGGRGSILSLEYNGSGLSSSSYSGSIASASYQYANLIFRPEGDSPYHNESASISLPFYNGDWWSVMITSGSSNGFELYASNKIYDGNDGFSIGFIESASITSSKAYTGWNFAQTAKFGEQSIVNSITFLPVSGAYQEIRYYNTVLEESPFRDFVMNPHSIEGNGLNSGSNQLAFRASLGSNLDNSSSKVGLSIHPKISGSWITTESFDNGSSTFEITSNAAPVLPTYIPNTEYYYVDQPAVGIKNRISEKVRKENLSLPLSGSTLSSYRRIQQNYPQSASSYTKDINYVEVAFSPQNEINDDINASLGYFNIGDYIGDPRQFMSSSTTYPDLDNLRDSYFEKYYKSYDWKDYIRLIKYFDNSLFKMVQDFVPANSGLATGVVVKQHLLERNRQKPVQTEFSQYYYSGSIESGFISGGQGGVFDAINFLTSSDAFINGVSPQVTQSWVYDVDTQYGPQVITQSTQDEFYNGEFSGSNFTATTGELNDENTSKKPSVVEINYDIIFFTSSITPSSPFQNSLSNPNQGEIYLWYDTGSYLNPGQGNPTSGNDPSSGFLGG